MQRVEFTVEPFVEADPGQHVIAAVDAVRALGVAVEFGPFGSECTVPTTQTAAVVAAIVDAAIAHAATHVTIDVSDIDQPPAAGQGTTPGHNAG